MIVDSEADISFLTETWLYSQGDEASYIASDSCRLRVSLVPPWQDHGEVASVLLSGLDSGCVSYKQLDYMSFEAVELKLSLKQMCTACVCLYRPPPSKSKLTNSTFLQEFPELLSQFADSHGDVSLVGDFNSHFDDDSDPQVAKLKTMLGDNNSTQLVDVPTHKRGHILDWVVVRRDGNRMSFDGVLDYPDLSDHKAVVCFLATASPQISNRLVTSRNIPRSPRRLQTPSTKSLT